MTNTNKFYPIHTTNTACVHSSAIAYFVDSVGMQTQMCSICNRNNKIIEWWMLSRNEYIFFTQYQLQWNQKQSALCTNHTSTQFLFLYHLRKWLVETCLIITNLTLMTFSIVIFCFFLCFHVDSTEAYTDSNCVFVVGACRIAICLYYKFCISSCYRCWFHECRHAWLFAR